MTPISPLTLPEQNAMLRDALTEAGYSLPDSYVSLSQKIRHVLTVTAMTADASDQARDERLVTQGMADCMDMVRGELIEAGIIDKSVPPMMVADAVCAPFAARPALVGVEPVPFNEAECRKSCNICHDENGAEWPCAKKRVADKRRKPAPAAPVVEAKPNRQYVTCTGKGGLYQHFGVAMGAGTKRGEEDLDVYGDTKTGNIYYRSRADFRVRMMPVTHPAAEQAKPEPVEPCALSEGAGQIADDGAICPHCDRSGIERGQSAGAVDGESGT